MNHSEPDLLSSDSSDEDYVPSDGEKVSEEENSGDEEDIEALQKDADDNTEKGKKRKLKKQNTKGKVVKARKRTGGIKLDDEKGEKPDECNDGEQQKPDLAQALIEEQKLKKEIDEKAKADMLWADFMHDVKGPESSKSSQASTKSSQQSTSAADKPAIAPNAKLKVTKEYDFAGEIVKVTKEVDASSVKPTTNQNAANNSEKPTASQSVASPAPRIPSLAGPKPASSGGPGLSGLLSKLGKKPKMSVLDKSKLDWDNYKEEQGITEDLKTFNKGKQGYVERMAFLQRTDQRQFEIERDMRQSTRKKPF